MVIFIFLLIIKLNYINFNFNFLGEVAGIIPSRVLMVILSRDEFSLSRLQILVIMSEATEIDGNLNYFQILSIVAKTIEFMFDPIALRQRAELILMEDLSTRSLLLNIDDDLFISRIEGLFNSHDLDHNGGLDEAEFRRCLQSLELELREDEISGLMISAQVKASCENIKGLIKFSDFHKFLKSNLQNLEVQKHLRNLVTLLHEDVSQRIYEAYAVSHANMDKVTAKERIERDNHTKVLFLHKEVDVLHRKLQMIFSSYDIHNTGLIAFGEIISMFRLFNLGFTNTQIDFLCATIKPTEGNVNVEISKASSLLIEILKTVKSKYCIQESKNQKDVSAKRKSEILLKNCQQDLASIVKYFANRINVIENTVSDAVDRITTLQLVFHSKHSGFSRRECAEMYDKLFENIENWAQEKDEKTRNFHFNSGAKIIKGKKVLSKHALEVTVDEIRLHTILTHLLKDEKLDNITSSLLGVLEIEKQRLVTEGTVSATSDYIPLMSCFNSLIRVIPNRAQLMCIILLFDQADDQIGVQYVNLARFTAEIFSQIGELLTVHEEATDSEILGGLTETDIFKFIDEKCSIVESGLTDANNDGTVHEDEFIRILTEIPFLNLTQKECMSIISPIERKNGNNLLWRELLTNWGFSYILNICKDREKEKKILNEKVPNSPSQKVVQIDEDQVLARRDEIQSIERKNDIMRNISKDIIEYIKISNVGDVISLVLPDDKSKAAIDNTHGDDDNSDDVHVHSLLRLVYHLPIVTHEAYIKKCETMLHEKAIEACLKSKNIPTFAVCMNISTIEQGMLAEKKIVISVTSCDGSFFSSLPLLTQLPSIALVDKDSAREFVKNLINKLYLKSEDNNIKILQITDGYE
jgi:Ca2+-binding EF-hand superfamily protein